MSVIEVKDLSKCYTITRNKKQWFRNLFMPQKETVYAVKNINLQIEKGASVGFIGPNGVYHHQDAHWNPGTVRRKREGEWPVTIQAEEGICQAHWGGIWKQEPAVVGSSGGGFF